MIKYYTSRATVGSCFFCLTSALCCNVVAMAQEDRDLKIGRNICNDDSVLAIVYFDHVAPGSGVNALEDKLQVVTRLRTDARWTCIALSVVLRKHTSADGVECTSGVESGAMWDCRGIVDARVSVKVYIGFPPSWEILSLVRYCEFELMKRRTKFTAKQPTSCPSSCQLSRRPQPTQRL